MRKLIIIFLFLFSINSIYSFDCDYFTDEKLKENCLETIEIDRNLVANLLYTKTFYPNHEYVTDFNNNITRDSYISLIDKENSMILKNVWTKILDVNPTVKYKGKLIVSERINVRVDNGFEYILPESYSSGSAYLSDEGKVCGKEHSISNLNEELNLFKDRMEVDYSDYIEINSDSELSLDYTVNLTMKIDEFRYEKKCKYYSHGECDEYKLSCNFYETTYQNDNVNIQDSVKLTLYNETSLPQFIIFDQYEKTLNGKLHNSSNSNTIVYNDDSFYRDYNYKFNAYFTDEYFLKIEAIDSSGTRFRNLIKSSDILFFSNVSDCNVFSTNFFKTKEGECEYQLIEKTISDFKEKPFDKILRILLNLLIFCTGLYFMYLAGKKIMKKIFPFLFMVILVLFLLIPGVFANSDPTEEVSECGIFDLEACFDLFFDKLYALINAPIQGLLDYVKVLMTEFPSLEIAKGKWVLMLYLVDALIAIHMSFSGLMLMINSHSPAKKSIAKENMFNSLIILILASSSYYLYDLAIEVSGALTQTIFNFVSDDFFLIHHSSSAILNNFSIGLDLALALIFFIELLLLFILFSIRYIVIGIGLILMPLAIFTYYVPKIRGIGAIIFKIIGFYMFFPVIAATIILGCDTMSYADDLLALNTIILIICFLIIGYVFYRFTEGIIKGTINFSGLNGVVNSHHSHQHTYQIYNLNNENSDVNNGGSDLNRYN